MLDFYPNLPINSDHLSSNKIYEINGDSYSLLDLSELINKHNSGKLKSVNKKINFDPNTNFNSKKEVNLNDININIDKEFPALSNMNIKMSSSQIIDDNKTKYVLKTKPTDLLRLPENYETTDEAEKKFIENINERSDEWKKINTKNPDVQIYNKTIDNKKSFITKAFARIPFSLSHIESLMENKKFLSKLDSIYKTTPKILNYEKETNNLTKSILYVDLDLPKSVRNRDLLLENSVIKNYGYNKTGLLYLFNSINNENLIKKNEDNIRVFINVYAIFFDRITDDESFVRICYQINFDNFLKFDNAYKLLPQSIDKWITDFITYGKERYLLQTITLPENYDPKDETENKFIDNINDTSNDWKKIRTKNPDVEIYNKIIDNKKSFITKAFAMVPFSINNIEKLMENKEFLSKLDSIYKTTPKILNYEKETNNLTKSILYVDLDLPKEIKNRDLLLENSVIKNYGNNGTGLLYLFNSINNENLMPENKDNIRVFINVYGIYFDKVSDDESFVRICYQINFDNFLKFDNAYKLLPQSLDKWITDFINYGKDYI
jgi:hypothetical protein